jgi:hypothetical protein
LLDRIHRQETGLVDLVDGVALLLEGGAGEARIGGQLLGRLVKRRSLLTRDTERRTQRSEARCLEGLVQVVRQRLADVLAGLTGERGGLRLEARAVERQVNRGENVGERARG